MPTIRITKEMAEFIKSHGRFGDSWDDIIRRLLKLKKKSDEKKNKIKR